MSPFVARTFQALEYPQFRIMWFGTIAAFLGMQMQIIVRGFLAYDLTKSNAALGGIMVSWAAPQMLLGLLGGVVADRLPKRRVLLISQTIMASNSAWIAAMIATGHLEYWMLLAAGVVQGSSFAFIQPARQALIADLVPRGTLPNAVVLQQLGFNTTRVIGPALAGVLIAVPFVGPAGLYFVTTAGFGLSTLALLALPADTSQPRTEIVSPLAEFRAGLAYIRSRPAIRHLILTSYLVVAFGFAYQSFLPAIAADMFGVGATGLGVLSSATAVGAVCATVVVAAYAAHRRAWAAHVLVAIGVALAVLALSASPVFAVGVVVMVAVGAFAAAFQSLSSSLTMMVTDRRYQGRVQSIWSMSWAFLGFGAFPLGLAIDAYGLREVLAAGAIVTIAAVVVLELAGRAWHAADDRKPETVVVPTVGRT